MLISPPEPLVVAESVERAESVDSGPLPLVPTLSDGQLLKRYLKRREEAAFGQLVSRFGALVYAVALRCLRDRHAAEDVFQATFLVLARDAAKIRRPESLGAWLHGTALRISKRALARRRHEVCVQESLESVMAVENESLLDEISEQFQQQLVDEELQRLPAAYRDPLVLHFLEGKTCEQTAAALGTTVGAVRGRLQRGKSELKLRLMKRGVEATSVVAAIFVWQSVAEAAMQPPLVSAAVQGGMAMAGGTPFAPACSPEAVHLAAKETAMFTTGKLLVSCTTLVCALAAGWLARAGVGDAQPAPLPPVPAMSTITADEATIGPSTLQVEQTLAFAGQAAVESTTSRPQLRLNYDDGKPDGRKSIAGTGEMIQFTLPDKSQKLQNLRVHCSRYGLPQAPDEDAEVTIVSADGTDVIHTEFVPYSTFNRSESRWTTVRFKEPVEVPETFWVILEFNAERTKGVYVSYDTSTGGKHSKTGVPGGEPKDVTFGGDWMVQAILTKPE